MVQPPHPQFSGQVPEACEHDPSHHGARADEPVQVPPKCLLHSSRDAPRHDPPNKGQFRTKVCRALHISERLNLAQIDKVAAPPEIAPSCSGGRHEMIDDSQWLVEDIIMGERKAMTHVHVIVVIRVEATDFLQSGAPH
jgi:hypothetical protein